MSSNTASKKGLTMQSTTVMKSTNRRKSKLMYLEYCSHDQLLAPTLEVELAKKPLHRG